MTAIPCNGMRPAKQGDTVPLNGRFLLAFEWTSRVPVEVTVTAGAPNGQVVAGARLEPQATIHPNLAPLRQSILLPFVADNDGNPATGRVEYETQNGEKPAGVLMGLVAQ